MVEVVVVPGALEAGRLVATAILGLVAQKPDAVLGLATGSTPLTIYRALATAVERGHADLSRLRGFALDEYVGLPEGHPQSYRAVIARDVVEPLTLTPDRIHVPDGLIESIRTAGAEFERAIVAAGGIDLQILGLGTDGHLAFNEPGSSLASLTRIKALTEQTRQDNARFFDSIDHVPTHAITQGLGTIRRAEHLVMLAFGEAKAREVASAIEGGVSATHPASIIQLHPHATVLVDEAAASQLENLAYYRHAWADKPDWQGL